MRSDYWKNTLHLFAAMGLVSLHGLVLVAVISKLEGAETLGTYSLVSTLLGFAFGVAPLGIGFLARRHLPSAETAEQRRNLFWPQWWAQATLMTFTGTAMALVLPRVAPWFGAKYGSGGTAWELGVFLMAYLVYSQFSDYFRSTHRASTFSLSMLAFPWLWLGMALTYRALGGDMDVPTLFGAQAVSAMVVGGVLALRATREMGLHFRLPARAVWGADIRLGYPVILTYVVDAFLAASDRFVIAATLSVREVGYYVPAYTLGTALLLLPRVAGVMLVPTLARYIDNGAQAEAERLVNNLVQAFLVLALPFVVLAAVLCKPLLSIYATPEATEAAWFVVPLVAAASLFYGLVLIFYNVLTVQLRTVDMFHANFLAAIINLGLNIVLLPVFRHLWVPAITTLLAYVVVWLLIRIKIRVCWHFDFPTMIFLRAMAAALLMGMTTSFAQVWLATRVSQPIVLTVCLLVGFSIYGVSAYALGVLRREQIGVLVRGLRRSHAGGDT